MKKFIKLIAVTAAIMVAVLSIKKHDAKAQTQDFIKMKNAATTASINEPQSFSIINLLTLKCM